MLFITNNILTVAYLNSDRFGGLLGSCLRGILEMVLFFFLANFAEWIYHHDISAYLGMHIFASMESFYMSAIFCFVFVLLLGTCYLSKNYWSKFSWSLGSENQFWVCSNQTLLLCLNYNYVSFNLYLFKRAIFDVI